ncbi:hypothetical protein QBC45DRAFT_43722 [Copromyces sp. CBS 386.78]|nr:hypothetical protein QBC45DRAFT_43722 [Copromyces sp. CBS 386.78]
MLLKEALKGCRGSGRKWNADARQPPSARHAQTSLWVGGPSWELGVVLMFGYPGVARGEKLHHAGQCNCITSSFFTHTFFRSLVNERTLATGTPMSTRFTSRTPLGRGDDMAVSSEPNYCRLPAPNHSDWVNWSQCPMGQGCSQRGRDLSEQACPGSCSSSLLGEWTETLPDHSTVRGRHCILVIMHCAGQNGSGYGRGCRGGTLHPSPLFFLFTSDLSHLAKCVCLLNPHPGLIAVLCTPIPTHCPAHHPRDALHLRTATGSSGRGTKRASTRQESHQPCESCTSPAACKQPASNH